MSVNKSDVEGWYHIDEQWNLYIDGELTETHVDFICVDNSVSGNSFNVKHFDRSGNLITTLTLEHGDISPVVRDLDETDRPWHI